MAEVTKEVLRLVKADRTRRGVLAGLREEGRRVENLLIAAGGLAMLAAACLLKVWNPLPGLPREIPFFIFALASGASAVWLVRWLLHLPWRKGIKRRRTAFLDASLCPAGAHDLTRVPARDDGCTICPECGAAWKLEQATKAMDDQRRPS